CDSTEAKPSTSTRIIDPYFYVVTTHLQSELNELLSLQVKRAENLHEHMTVSFKIIVRLVKKVEQLQPDRNVSLCFNKISTMLRLITQSSSELGVSSYHLHINEYITNFWKGKSNNQLVLPTNPALLQQQSQAQQYANNFVSQHSMNQRVLNTGIPQQQQQMTIERNFGTINNPNLQQMRGLGGEGGNNITNQYIFQGRQSLSTSAAAPIPSISALGNQMFSNNMTTNMLGFPSQSNINGLGLDMFQQPSLNRGLGQVIAQQTQQRQMMQQPRRPVTHPQPVQNLHHRSSHQKPSSEQTKKPHTPPVPKPYEPAPDLTSVQKKYLEQYVRRDTLYQKALDIQHKRQMNVISEKRKEIAHADLIHQTRSSYLFGTGYGGYGNGVTGTRFRIVYPHDRKRSKKTKEFKFSHQQLREIAKKEDILVPIRLEIDGADGYKLRDTFTWNMNETLITPEHFAEVLCDDLHFPAATFVPAIVKQMRDQLQGYILHPLSLTDQFPTNNIFSSLTDPSEDTCVIKEENDNDNKSNILNNSEESNINEELRILIKIDVTIGNISLVDQFEWDINCQKNDPELFAEILTAELGLGGEFKTAISHSIREQVQIYVKSLILVGHPFDGSPVQDDDLRQSLLPPVTNIIRREDSVDQHTPILVELTEAEIDKIEKDRERDARRKRRQTRGRRGVILPDREPPKTHRTLLHSTTIIPDPTDENGFITLISSGMPPVMRKSSSMGYDNYSAISEKSTAPSPGKVRGRGRAAGSGLRGIINANSPDITDINSTGRSGSVGPSPQGRELRDGAKKSNRRGTSKELEEWHCDGCGCSQTATPLLRKGPNGEKTLCNACGKSVGAINYWNHPKGLYFQKNNTLRPISQVTNEDEFNLSKLQEPYQSANSAFPANKTLQPSQQDIPSTLDQSFEFTVNDKQPNSSNEQNLISKQHFETTDNQNLAQPQGNNLITSTKSQSPVTIPNAPLSNKPVIPEWIVQQREQLLQKYPRDRFDIIQKPNNPNELRIKCFDCPRRLYQLGDGLSLKNFEIHLKNREHRTNVEKRLNPDWAFHISETSGVTDSVGTISGTIESSELSSPVSGTGDTYTSFNTDNKTMGIAEGSIVSRPDYMLQSREISSSSSQSLKMSIGRESGKSSRGGMKITSDINNVNSAEYEMTAVEVFIDNSNGIPQTPQTETFPSKSKGPL
ncbi:17179_t:CDS:10, partial [Funneliformis geosporum]